MKAHKAFFVILVSFFTLFLFVSEGYSYTITANSGAGGSISPSGAVPVTAGDNQTFTITPDPDYGVLDILVDSVSVGPVFSYTFSNVAADHSISASFSACDYLFPVMLEWNGSLFGSIMAAYDYAIVSGLNDFTLKLMAGTLLQEDIYFDANVLVEIRGGHDCSFLDNSMVTRFPGSLTIAAGTVIPSNIVLSAPPPCEEGDPNNFPGNPEICDGLDNNCNGLVDDGLTFDTDGDGVTSVGSCEGSADDCDDNDPNNFPGNPEICDGSDNNCDGQIDEGLSAVDTDGDGYSAIGSCGGSADDCNDNDAGINPGATEILGDGIDQDCDGQDLIFSVDGDCFGCHSVFWVNTLRHTNVMAPDGTCADCHAAPVSAVLPGHYGEIVRTAGNNMTAGSIIGCTACHDWHDEAESGYAIPGDYIVWAKVHAAGGYGNLSCDTCHENRAAEHATGTAHNNRIIDSSCGQCHTSDTSVLGSPGTGTLASDADVDTLHRSDCALCHNYSGIMLDAGMVEQVIQDGLNGTPVTCTDCHATHPMIDHSDIVTTTGTSCGTCHTGTALVDPNDPKVHNACFSCHDANYNLISLAEGKSAPGNCTTCHGTDFTPIHPDTVDHASLVTVGATSCADCHSDPPPLVDAADPQVHNACISCHNTDGGLVSLASGKSFSVGGDCATCHTDPFETVHPTTTDHSGIVTTTGTNCGTCHTSTSLVDAVDPKVHNSCSSCHDANGALISLATGKSVPGNCNSCHGTDFTTIHPDMVDHIALVTVGTTSCGNCHSDPPPLVDPADPRVHNSCASCHDTNGGLVSLAFGKSFAVGGDCIACHDENTYTEAHGCTGCHGEPPTESTPGGPNGLIGSPSEPTGYPSSGAHEIHASSSGYNFSCEYCHQGGMDASSLVLNDQLDIDFDSTPFEIDNVDPSLGLTFVSFDSTTQSFDGIPLSQPYQYSAGNTTGGSNTCANTYCHSDGTAVATRLFNDQIPANTSPSWEGTTTCESCHGYAPDYTSLSPKTNAHDRHIGLFYQGGINQDANPCHVCHYNTTMNGTTISDKSKHVNGQYDVVANPNSIFKQNLQPENQYNVSFTYNYDPRNSSCSNISCHTNLISINHTWGYGTIPPEPPTPTGWYPEATIISGNLVDVTVTGAPFGKIYVYWGINQGSSSFTSGNSVQHTYPNGTYEISVRVYDLDHGQHWYYWDSWPAEQSCDTCPSLKITVP